MWVGKYPRRFCFSYHQASITQLHITPVTPLLPPTDSETHEQTATPLPPPTSLCHSRCKSPSSSRLYVLSIFFLFPRHWQGSYISHHSTPVTYSAFPLLVNLLTPYFLSPILCPFTDSQATCQHPLSYDSIACIMIKLYIASCHLITKRWGAPVTCKLHATPLAHHSRPSTHPTRPLPLLYISYQPHDLLIP